MKCVLSTCLQLVHPSLVKSFEEHKSSFAKRAADDDDQPGSKKMKSEPKQTNIVNYSDNKSAKLRIRTQAEVDNLIVQYIICEMRPLATVEKPAFKALVEGLSGNRKVMCRKTLSNRIEEKYTEMLAKISQEMKNATCVCTTADIWSINSHSYLGMTAHWITDSLERQSVALACRRFVGSHTHDRIADHISDIHSSFSLEISKISHTVTDGASNFRKAFEEFQQGEPDDMEEEDNAEFTDIHSVLDAGQQDSDSNVGETYLPKHLKCCSHTLNLIGSTDANSARSNATFSRLYNTSMGKCQAIWNSVRRSSKAADTVHDICSSEGKHFLVPCATRWNSTYDSICRVLQLKDKLAEVCIALDLPKFKQNEIDFLSEYCNVMQPLAATLDVLQGETNCFYGMVLPKLVQLRNSLTQIMNGNLVSCEPLALVLLDSINRRYGNLLELQMPDAKCAIVAAVSHPKYKMRWIPPDNRDSIRQMFTQCVQSIWEQACNSAQVSETLTVCSRPVQFTAQLLIY